jgi:kynurenine formamidase
MHNLYRSHQADTVLPTFDELPRLEGLDMPHSWGLLDPNLGTLSNLTSKVVLHATTLVIDGVSVGLNLPLGTPDPPLFGRPALKHDVFSVDRNTVDDRLDTFFPQASSQWDGLRHIRAREHGFYGGVTEEFQPSGGVLGIDAWAKRGIVGRGILLDIVALRERQRREYSPMSGEAIEVDDLRQAAADQKVKLLPGDIVCVRTGWIAAYRQLDSAMREEVARNPRTSGLAGSEDMARYLWDAQASALCADNPSVEMNPSDPTRGFLHRRLVPTLGFALAELLDLDPLAQLCQSDGRWDFLFVAMPLNLPGGVGSPANAVAIR